MEQNHIAHSALSPEAATDEPASSFEPAGDDPRPFATEEEAVAYHRGVAHGIRCAGREPGHPHMPADFSLDLTRDGAGPGLTSSRLLEAWPYNPADEAHGCKPRAVRHDGWTVEKQRLFIETLADSGVVADACRAAGMSRDAAYACRRRASGRVFALAWDAALLLSRARLSDEVMARSIHGVIDRVYRNGELVAERHRYDNRLTMAVLARLDRLAEGLGENAPVARAVAQEFDQFLEGLGHGNQAAEAFLAARFPGPVEEPAGVGGDPRPGGTEQALLARLAAYEEYGAALPSEMSAGLDPREMERWSEAQWARAEASGFLAALADADWPEAARLPGSDDADGMCKLRKLYLAFRPSPEAPARPEEPEQHEEEEEEEEENDEEDDFEGCCVWEGEDGEWITDFPPPAGFAGWEEGEPGEESYRRALTEEELAVVREDGAEEEEERAEQLAARHQARDRYFGFAPSAPAGQGEPGAGLPAGAEQRVERDPDAPLG